MKGELWQQLVGLRSFVQFNVQKLKINIVKIKNKANTFNTFIHVYIKSNALML